jgi:hypothetical protein
MVTESVPPAGISLKFGNFKKAKLWDSNNTRVSWEQKALPMDN